MPLKRTSFPLTKTQILSDSELYRVGKVFLEKLLQNVILINHILVIFKQAPEIQIYLNNPVVRLKSFFNASFTNIQT